MADLKKSRFSFQLNQDYKQKNANVDNVKSIENETFVMDTTEPNNVQTNMQMTLNTKKIVPSRWMKIILSSISAVVTGISLGMMILIIIQSNKDVSPTQGTSSDGMPTQSTKQQYGNVVIPKYTFYTIQLGVYSNKKNAIQAIAELRSKAQMKNLKSVYSVQNDKYHVFIGFHHLLGEANKNVSQLKQNEIFGYVKPYKLLSIQKSPQNEQRFNQLSTMKWGRELVYELMIDRDAEKINQLHRQWSNKMQKMIKIQEPSMKGSHTELMHTLNEAFLIWTEKRRHFHPDLKYDLQIKLLQYLVLEKSIFE